MKRFKLGLVGAAASFVLCVVGDVLAADTVMVLELTGHKKQAVRDRLIQSMEKDGIEVEALEKQLWGKAPSDERLGEVGKRRNVGVFLAGDVAMKKSGWTLTLVARDAETGAVKAELPLKAPWLPKLFETIDAEAPKFVREHIEKVEAEPLLKEEEEEKPPEEPQEKAPPAEEKEDDDAARASNRPSPFTLSLGVRAVHRTLDYSQDVNRNLRPYELPLAPALAAGLSWYPAAHFTDGVAAHLGIVLDVERSFLAASDLGEGTSEFDTVLFAYSAGLRARIPFDAHEVGISGRFGRHSFEIEGDRDAAARSASGSALVRDFVPDVAYAYVRPALDARFAFGAVALGMSLGYRIVTGAGDLQDDVWFPAAEVMGADASLFGSYALAPAFHAVLGVELRRYGLDMQSKPSDLPAGRDVAGGAVDQYLSGFLGVEWRPSGS